MDLNNDGIKDVIHGSGGSSSYLYYGNSDGTMTDQGAIQVGGANLHLYYYSFYEVTDWNEDGLWDLVAFGAKEDTYTLYINEGTKEQYLFNEEQKIGFPDLPATRNCPALVDFDYDGKKDILNGVSEGGEIQFFKNRGTNEAPAFDYSDKEILLNDAGDGWTGIGLEAKIDVGDLNGDGKWDIIAGGCGGGKPMTEQFLYISYGYGGKGTSTIEVEKPVAVNNLLQHVSVGNVNGSYSLSNTSSGAVTFSLFNVRGVQLYGQQRLEANQTLNLDRLSSQNMYVLQIEAGGQTYSQQILPSGR